MSTSVGHWQITARGPQRSPRAEVDLESKLEGWIERDPTLLRTDLCIVGRQLSTEGGPLDLLAIGLQGRWAVIEVKRGRVRRETVTQAIDYASCIRRMSKDDLKEAVAEYLKKSGSGSLDKLRGQHPEAFDAEPGKREVEIIVVGTGRDSGLERIVDYMQASGQMAVSVVTFEVFRMSNGQQALVRELTETDEGPKDRTLTVNRREGELRRAADSLGIGGDFKRVLDLANAHGLKKRVTSKSIMYAPPSDGRRVLFLVYGAERAKNGGLLVYCYPPAFEEFLDLKPSLVIKTLGVNGWGGLASRQSVEKFISGLGTLLRSALTPTKH